MGPLPYTSNRCVVLNAKKQRFIHGEHWHHSAEPPGNCTVHMAITSKDPPGRDPVDKMPKLRLEDQPQSQNTKNHHRPAPQTWRKACEVTGPWAPALAAGWVQGKKVLAACTLQRLLVAIPCCRLLFTWLANNILMIIRCMYKMASCHVM